MPCERIDRPAMLTEPAAVIWLCGRGRKRAAAVPELNRKTLQRGYCPKCAYPHGQTVACPPRGVWLAEWSLRVNGRIR